jgi:hypothetical protein
VNTEIGTCPHAPFRPGFLLGPLGWLNEQLSARRAPDPGFLSLLFGLEPPAMHMLGIAVAHGCERSLLTTLFRQAPRAIVEQSVGFWPEGLDRLVRALPAMALSREQYRAIPGLLSDRSTAKFLQHQRAIDGLMITGLFSLPPILRRQTIFKLFGRCERIDRFVHGLRYLAERVGLSFNVLLNELGSFDQTDEIVAKIAELVDNLPLPATLPPPFVSSFHRIDRVTEIRSLAKTWHNCLAEYLFNISEGTAAVYRSDNGEPRAVALVSRFYRMGWLLNQIRGPDNTDIERSYLVDYQTAFLKAGIPDYPDVAAIRDLILQARWPNFRY